jgi:hypothetical protein
MDMLIIKKDRNVVTKNSIGKIFRGHNIVEFKSPTGTLNYARSPLCVVSCQ